MLQDTVSSHVFDIKPSRLLRQFVSLGHVLAISACWLTSLPNPFKAFLTLLLAALWVLTLIYEEASGKQLRYTSRTGWEISSSDQEESSPIKFLAGTTMSHWVLFLRYETDNTMPHSLLVARDSMTTDRFRLLMVRIKLSGYGC